MNTEEFQSKIPIYIENIELAIDELESLHSRIAASLGAPSSHQQIGAVVHAFSVLLTTPVNYLCNRNVVYPQNFFLILETLNRSFFSLLHSHVEAALAEICTNLGMVEVINQRQNKIKCAFKAFEDGTVHLKSELESVQKQIKCLKRQLKGNIKPEFNDYLNSVFKNVTFLADKVEDEDVKKKWRNYFDAISKIRNKSSHSDVILNEIEQNVIKDAKFGLELMLAPEGKLRIKPSFYPQIISFTLDFFDELDEAMKKQKTIRNRKSNSQLE